MTSMSSTALDGGVFLDRKGENITPNTVGLAVDYLTRVCLETPPPIAFRASLIGAAILGKERLAGSLLSSVKGNDPSSIVSACKLAGFDVAYRMSPIFYKKPVEDINPNEVTIDHISTMVSRSLKFIDEYGPFVKDGFSFPKGAYTDLIVAGDGDFLTEDTLWDFKVLSSKPNKDHTLQLLIYYLMGMRTIQDPEIPSDEAFRGIKNLGIFNPRFNRVYQIPIESIDEGIIEVVSKKVIGYDSDIPLSEGLEGLVEEKAPRSPKPNSVLDQDHIVQDSSEKTEALPLGTTPTSEHLQERRGIAGALSSLVATLRKGLKL